MTHVNLKKKTQLSAIQNHREKAKNEGKKKKKKRKERKVRDREARQRDREVITIQRVLKESETHLGTHPPRDAAAHAHAHTMSS